MRLSVWMRRDTDGNLCPIKRDGKVYPFFGELRDGNHLLVSAWGVTDGDVTNELREEWLKREGKL